VIMALTTKPWAVVVTCEHGGNSVPKWLRERFAGAEDVLASHRGWDPGALGIATTVCESLGAARFAARTSRLVVDLNRSVTNPTLFSEFTRDAPAPERDRILAEHYQPYRDKVEQAVRSGIEKGQRVMHISVHTFTPVLGEDRRTFDAGILFDPARHPEASIAQDWIVRLWNWGPRIDVRANQPYLGTDDGFTTALRGMFPADRYVGIEVEIRNDLARDPEAQTRWGSRLAATLGPVLSL